MPPTNKKQQKATTAPRATKKPGGNRAPPAAAPSQQQKVVSPGVPSPEKPAEVLPLDEPKVQVEQLLKDECENEEIVEEFICRICQIHVVGCSPKLTTCSHLFCGDCMDQWLKSHQTNQTWAQRAQTAGAGGRTAPCPVCKHPLQESDSLFAVSLTGTPESAMLWRMLSSLKVTCCNHSKVRKDGLCTWTGRYGDYVDHVQYCDNGVCTAPVIEVNEEEPPEGVDAHGFDQIVKSEPVEAVKPVVKPIVQEKVKDAWDDDDDDETEMPSPDSVREKAESDHSVATPEASTAADEPQVLAEESTETSETESLEKAQAAQPQTESASVVEEVHKPVEPVKEELAPIKAEKTDAMSDLLSSIRALVDLKLQDAGSETTVQASQASKPVQEEASKSKISYVFNAENDTQLSLVPGDSVQVLEQHASGWTYGRKGAQEGWFPAWCI